MDEEKELTPEERLQQLQEAVAKPLVDLLNLSAVGRKNQDDALRTVTDILFALQMDILRLDARLATLEGETNE